ncbi:MAG: arsenate reductase ArsC [Wenzhouxiangellaceae bacterium]|nr:arsenate reductase ArsC [Wenzhouxiangellaceae bacterium]
MLLMPEVSEQAPLSVLVLCTGNSARSIMAEALFSHYGAGRIHACSAGSHPAGWVHPMALAQIAALDRPGTEPASKSWHEFTGPEAPVVDVVVTVCGNAACETSPEFPGTPLRVHWGLDDPSIIEGDDQRREAFSACFGALERRIRILAQRLQINTSRTEALRWMCRIAKKELQS